MINEPASGSLRVMDDVLIEERADRTVTVLACEPVATGRSMVLVFDHAGGTSKALIVNAVSCAPAVVDGIMRQRVRLEYDGPWKYTA